jgi:ankyrin repeat protein
MDDNESPEGDDYLDALIHSVKTSNLPHLRQLLVRGADVNSIEPLTTNSLLHLAVLNGGYNIAVHLLNRGCNTALRNSDGLTAVQLAQRLPERGAFAVAIQLSNRKRQERHRRQQQQLAVAAAQVKAAGGKLSSAGPFSSLHELTRRNLESARGSLASLEGQVMVARALVQSLEHQLIVIESAAELQRRKDVDGDVKSFEANFDLEVVRCGVCLEISRTKIFQCNEGTIRGSR